MNPTVGRIFTVHDNTANTNPPIKPTISPTKKNLNSIQPSCAFLLNMRSPFLFLIEKTN